MPLSKDTNTDALFLIRYQAGGSAETRYALQSGDPSQPVYNLALEPDELVTLPADRLIDTLLSRQGAPLTLSEGDLRPPVEAQEVWAAGVTYKRSEEARELESNNSTIYTRVYHALRPELFFKANAREVVGTHQAVGIRYDATWSVPEPELVVALNTHREVIGFSVGNDMSSRDIEGDNPLYLPQAKVYERACAIGPRIWLQPGQTTWPELNIVIDIARAGQVIFTGETSTRNIHRPLSELIDYLGRCKPFAAGAFLFSGTGIVPPDSFTLQADDVIRIRIDPVGELVNTVQIVGKR